MPRGRVTSVLRRICRPALGLAALAALALMAAPRVAGEGESFVVSIDNASVKVGERAVITATIATREGFKITESYRHRIRRLSAPPGVELASKIVTGSVRDGKVVFLVGVTPRKAGTHTVTGFFRFSLHNGQTIDIKSAPFEATVTAIE
jgi:hypothetical protein